MVKERKREENREERSKKLGDYIITQRQTEREREREYIKYNNC